MSSRVALFALLFVCGCVARGVSAEQAPDGGRPTVDDGSISIMELRDPSSPKHPALGAPVVVRGGVVIDVKATGTSHGFFMQDPEAKSYAAVYVFMGPDLVDVEVGDAIARISGTYSTYLGNDEIDARAGTFEAHGPAVPPEPIDVTLADIEPNGNRPLELQSMLVRVTDVVATSDTSGRDFELGAYDSSASIDVTSYMANDVGPSPFPASAGQRFAYIVGHVYVDGVPELAPMSADDVVAE